MGECPDWYTVIQAAKYVNVSPWALMEQPVWWFDKIVIAMNAEASAKKTLEARSK
jgi:hypothetical protein